MDFGVIYTGIPEQYNIWLYFITHYRKISRYNFSKKTNKTKYKGVLFKTKDFEPATSGRVDTRASSNVILMTTVVNNI